MKESAHSEYNFQEEENDLLSVSSKIQSFNDNYQFSRSSLNNNIKLDIKSFPDQENNFTVKLRA